MQEENVQKEPTISAKSSLAKPLVIGLTLLILILTGATAYLGYQNIQFQKQIAKVTTLVSSPTPSSTSDLTANWKTYSYPTYNYSFKIPSSYIVSVNGSNPKETWILQSLNLSETNALGGPTDLILTVQSQILPAVLETIGTLSNFTQTGTTTIKGRQWIIATHTIGSVTESQYITQVGNLSYTVDGTNTKFIEQILSTFQFITPTSQTDTSNWKTYTDSKNMFMFKYPSEATLENKAPNLVDVTFIGPKQKAAGKIYASLYDGYIFDVLNREGDIDTVASQQRQDLVTTCNQSSTISPITKVTIANKDARTFTVQNCLQIGTSTEYYINGNHGVIQLDTDLLGEPQDQLVYKTSLDQILSTFKFTQ